MICVCAVLCISRAGSDNIVLAAKHLQMSNILAVNGVAGEQHTSFEK